MSSTVRGPENEPSLINRALGGDRNAFYALIEPCENAIFMTAWALLKDKEKAEEAAQQAVAKAFSNLGHFRGELTFSAWIVQVTLDQAGARAGDFRGGNRELPVQGESVYRPGNTNTWREIPPEALQNPQCRSAINRSILNLDAPSCIVFVLRDMQRFSLAETAKILRISEADVRALLSWARLQICDELAPGMKESWAAGGLAPRKAASC